MRQNSHFLKTTEADLHMPTATIHVQSQIVWKHDFKHFIKAAPPRNTCSLRAIDSSSWTWKGLKREWNAQSVKPLGIRQGHDNQRNPCWTETSQEMLTHAVTHDSEAMPTEIPHLVTHVVQIRSQHLATGGRHQHISWTMLLLLVTHMRKTFKFLIWATNSNILPNSDLSHCSKNRRPSSDCSSTTWDISFNCDIRSTVRKSRNKQKCLV